MLYLNWGLVLVVRTESELDSKVKVAAGNPFN